MFKKRFTLGLLFLASKLILNVKATCTPAIAEGGGLQISGDCTPGYYLKTSSAAVTDATSCTNNAKCTLMKCSALNENCVEATITGYIIFTLNYSLLYCSVGQCYSVTSPGGLYINGDTTTGVNPIIKCETSTCSTIAYASNCNNIGGVRSTKAFCYSKSNTNGQSMTGTSELYLLLTLTANTAPFGNANDKVLVKIGNNAVEKVTTPSGYYAVASGEKLVNCDGTSHVCTEAPEKQGYFVNGASTDYPIIKCTASSCGTIATANIPSTCAVGGILTDNKFCYGATNSEAQGLSAISSTQYYLLTLLDATTPFGAKDSKAFIKVVKDAAVLVSSPAAGYYINSGAAASTPSLIKCGASACEIITSPSGLYVNGDTTTGVNPVIQCASGSACSSVAYVTACSSGLGGIITNNKFCFSTTDANGQDITGETVIYDLLTLTADTAPFGSANDKVLVKVGNSAVEKVTDPTGYYAVSSAEMLVQCDAGNHACTSVTSPQGYYVNAGEDSASKPVIQCDGTTCSTTSTTKSKCSTVDKIGDLVAISNVQTNFCPSKTDGTQISFRADRTEAGFYLLTIAKDSKSVFTGNTAVTADTTVVVQAGIGEVVPVANPTGYYINAGAAANTPSVIKCDASHVCEIITSTGGFYVNGDTSTGAKPVIQCVSGDACTAIDGETNCSTGKVKTGNTYCVDNTNEADFKAITVSYYLLTVAKSSTSVFTGKNTVGDNTKVLVQSGNNAIFVVDSPSGYYVNSDTTSLLVYCDSTGCDDHETAGGYYLNAGEDKSANPVITCTGTTIDCTANPATTTTSCASVTSIGGLVKISDNFNYFCPEKTEGKQITINSDATLTYHKLTIAAGGTNPFTEATESESIDILVKVGNGAAELITNASNSENAADFYAVKESNVITDMTAYDECSPNNGIIKYNFAASSGSISAVRQCIQPCNLASTNATGCKEGYYLADDDKKYVMDTDDTGTLYKCVKDADGKFQCSAVANPPLGYLVNQGNQADPEDVPFIRCEVSGEDTVCKPYTIDGTIEDCTSESAIGEIISKVESVSDHDITTYSICVDMTAEATIAISTRAAVEDEPNLTITAETNTAGSYMISNVMYDSTLDDGEFIKVDVDGGNVTINQEPNPIRYQYGDKNTHKIYDSFTCTVTNGEITVSEPASPKEYKLDYDTSADTIYFYSTDA